MPYKNKKVQRPSISLAAFFFHALGLDMWKGIAVEHFKWNSRQNGKKKKQFFLFLVCLHEINGWKLKQGIHGILGGIVLNISFQKGKIDKICRSLHASGRVYLWAIGSHECSLGTLRFVCPRDFTCEKMAAGTLLNSVHEESPRACHTGLLYCASVKRYSRKHKLFHI